MLPLTFNGDLRVIQMGSLWDCAGICVTTLGHAVLYNYHTVMNSTTPSMSLEFPYTINACYTVTLGVLLCAIIIIILMLDKFSFI